MKKTFAVTSNFCFAAGFAIAALFPVAAHAIDYDANIQHHCFLDLGQYQENQNHVSDEQNGSRCATDSTAEYDCTHSVSTKNIGWSTHVHCAEGQPCQATQSHLCAQPNGVKYTSTKSLTCPSAANNIKSDMAGTSCYTGTEGTSSYSVTAYAPPC